MSIVQSTHGQSGKPTIPSAEESASEMTGSKAEYGNEGAISTMRLQALNENENGLRDGPS